MPGGAAGASPGPVRAPRPAIWVATFAGIGFFPWAPATLASLVVLVLWLLLPPLSAITQGVLLVVVTWVGVVTATTAEKELGLDAHPIVIDEVAGMLVTYLFVPFPGGLLPRLLTAGVGFVLFRIFDIVKPWPIDKLQHLPGGQGIMADDLLAGVYSNVILRLILLSGLIGRLTGGAP